MILLEKMTKVYGRCEVCSYCVLQLAEYRKKSYWKMSIAVTKRCN